MIWYMIGRSQECGTGVPWWIVSIMIFVSVVMAGLSVYLKIKVQK